MFSQVESEVMLNRKVKYLLGFGGIGIWALILAIAFWNPNRILSDSM